MVKVLFKPKELDLVCTIIIIIVTPFFLNWILVCYKVTWLGQGEGGGGGGQGGPRLLSQLPEHISGERVNTKQSPSKS